ncbi:MAG TPA: portal protein, partial [Bacteroidales bacterium]|nr:portal protein [Bacteroidales bacterium]
MEKSIVEIAKTAYDEAKSAIDGWNSEARIDQKFYLSDQWDKEDEEKLKKKGVPVLNLNHIKKTIDLIVGYQRQNRSDLKYYPIENGDSLVAEILTKISMWVMKSNNSRYYLSEAFKDSVNTGVGWIYPVLDYSRDPINGDIYLRQENPFNMLFDPFFTEIDLSDCDYIIRHKLLNKRKAKKLWPDHADEIENLGSAVVDNYFRQDASVPKDQGNQVLVWEYWYRDYKEKNYVVSQNGDFQEITEEKKEEAENIEDVEIVTKQMPVVNLAIMVGESQDQASSIVVYDGDNPYGINDFPFIPIWCYLTTSYAYWDKKLQGVIRPLRDPQREKNKRRSQAMHIMNSVASSGYDIEKGAYDDVNKFNKGGAGKIFERNRGFAPAQRIQPPDMPASVIQMEQLFGNDLQLMGASPDLLGHVSEKNAPGITIQLRQKQGMTTLQEIFDNLSMAFQAFGRMLIGLIVNNFSEAKVQRILGEEIPFKNEIQQTKVQIQRLKQQLMQGAQDLQEMTQRETSNDQEFQQMEAQEQQLQAQLYEMQVQVQQLEQQLQQLIDEEKLLWEKWDLLENESFYDCSVSETIENETYRISVLSALMQAQQYGMPVPPNLLLEYL